MGPRSSRHALTALAAALVLGTGCGGTKAHRPAPADPGIVRGGQTERPPAGSESGRPGPAGDSPRNLDPSEEITPEELASIPEPLPATSPALKAGEDQPMKSGPQAPSEAPSGASQTRGAAIPEPDSGAYVWRVQIFASDQREEAERVSREAVEALDATASVDRDGALYKVRLGRFATEAEAQALRERAIRAGYPGAFRIRIAR